MPVIMQLIIQNFVINWISHGLAHQLIEVEQGEQANDNRNIKLPIFQGSTGEAVDNGSVASEKIDDISKAKDYDLTQAAPGGHGGF